MKRDKYIELKLQLSLSKNWPRIIVKNVGMAFPHTKFWNKRCLNPQEKGILIRVSNFKQGGPGGGGGWVQTSVCIIFWPFS